MNKWTMLSVVVLVSILAVSVWMITQTPDPMLESEPSVEDDIGVEEFDSEPENPVGADSDAETIVEPDMSVDDSGEEDAGEQTPPGEPAEADEVPQSEPQEPENP